MATWDEHAGPAYRPYPGPTEFERIRPAEWAADVTMTEGERGDLQRRIKLIEDRKRELRAAGLPWPEVCRQIICGPLVRFEEPVGEEEGS